LSRDPEPKALAVPLPARPDGVRVVGEDRNAFLARLAREEVERPFVRGLAAGEARAIAGAAGALTRAAEQLENASASACDDLAHDAIELALEIARTILRCSIDAQRHDMERIVRETLQASGVGRGNCVVHLNPSDATRLTDVVFRSGTTIESDPEVAPGGVHVTTARGLLVRDVEQALASIGERLRGDLT
jgi:flagellar biosynthesis/type III secretory pathway protein FliH